MPARLRAEVYERDGFECQRCGATEKLSIDHRLPVSLGGSDDPSNLWVLCMSCNFSKHNSTDEKWLKKLTPEERAKGDEAIAAIKAAVVVRDAAHAEYRAVIEAEAAAGRSYASIAAAAGVSRQAVRQLVMRRAAP